MIRTLLLVPERPAGWHAKRVLPLLDPQECATYGALVSAGVPIEVTGVAQFLDSDEANEELLAIVRSGGGPDLELLTDGELDAILEQVASGQVKP